MSRTSRKQSPMTGPQSFPKGKMDGLEVDPNLFRSSIEKYQDGVLRPIYPLPPEPKKEPLSGARTAKGAAGRSRNRPRKQTSSFIKFKAGTLPVENKEPGSAKKILALRLPNGIELEFWS